MQTILEAMENLKIPLENQSLAKTVSTLRTVDPDSELDVRFVPLL